MLSADASGAHALVQLGRFGWIDTGITRGLVFTPLRGIAPYATQVAAAW